MNYEVGGARNRSDSALDDEHKHHFIEHEHELNESKVVISEKCQKIV